MNKQTDDFPLDYVPKYFSETEMNLASPSCSLRDMDSDFLRKIDNLREMCGFPFYVNSAYRSRQWDKDHGRSGNGYHTLGRAMDIHCTSSQDKFLIVQMAPYCGIQGIGIAKNFVHLDDRLVGAIWSY